MKTAGRCRRTTFVHACHVEVDAAFGCLAALALAAISGCTFLTLKCDRQLESRETPIQLCFRHIDNHISNKGVEVELEMSIVNVSDQWVTLSDSATNSDLGLQRLAQIYVYRDGHPVLNPVPFEDTWPFCVPEAVFDERLEPLVSLFPGERMVFGHRKILLDAPGRYRVWCTLFLPADRPNVLHTFPKHCRPSEKGVTLRSNVVEIKLK